MPFKWKDFFSIAEHLRDDFNDSLITEAAQRCAISRAYYAAICHARDFAISRYAYHSLGFEDHSELRKLYKQRGMARIATNLDKLRQWRNDCDYKNSLDPSSLSAMIKGMSQCKYVLDHLPRT